MGLSLAAAGAALSAALAVWGCADLASSPAHAGLRGRVAATRGVVASLPARAAWLSGVARISPVAGLEDRIAAAGGPARLSARDWMALKCLCGAAAVPATAFAGGALPGRLWLVAIIAAPPAAFLVPDFWLARVARERAEAALRELPGMLDLLRVTVEAGQAPLPAMGLIGERFAGPLAAEWRTAAAHVALGISHDAALREIARRLPVDGVRTLVDTLAAAGRSGLPLAGALAAQAAAARHARRRHIRECAARAAPKMQLVVAIVLVPSVMLTIAAVLAAELTGTGLGLGY